MAATTALVLYLLVVAGIVLAPSAEVPSESIWWITKELAAAGAPSWVSQKLVEVVTNVLLFVPLSLLGSFLRPSWSVLRWTLVGLVLSSLVELTQLVLLDARSASVGDVLANTTGALVGALLARAVRSAVAGRPRS